MRARGARATTGARARDARANRGARVRGARARPRCARVFARAPVRRARANKLSARANKLSKSQIISSPNPLLESLFARARVSDGCAREHARASWPCSRTSRARASICSRVSRARLSLLAHLARACVKCSRACARTISTGNVSYVLKNDNIYTHVYVVINVQTYVYTGRDIIYPILHSSIRNQHLVNVLTVSCLS